VDPPPEHGERSDHDSGISPRDVAIRTGEPRPVVGFEDPRFDREAALGTMTRLLAKGEWVGI